MVVTPSGDGRPVGRAQVHGRCAFVAAFASHWRLLWTIKGRAALTEVTVTDDTRGRTTFEGFTDENQRALSSSTRERMTNRDGPRRTGPSRGTSQLQGLCPCHPMGADWERTHLGVFPVEGTEAPPVPPSRDRDLPTSADPAHGATKCWGSGSGRGRGALSFARERDFPIILTSRVASWPLMPTGTRPPSCGSLFGPQAGSAIAAGPPNQLAQSHRPPGFNCRCC
jgi:hypothetical protein